MNECLENFFKYLLIFFFFINECLEYFLSNAFFIMTKSGIIVRFMRVEFDEACRQTKYYIFMDL